MTDDSPPPADQLAAVRDNTLQENYQPHDIAQSWLRQRLEQAGYVVEQIGTDNRYADTTQYGSGPDLAVYDAGVWSNDPDGLIEVKSKRLSSDGDEWFGCLNERHLEEYVTVAAEEGVFVCIYMTVVDEDREMVVRDGFFPVTECVIEERFPAHGNTVVQLDVDETQRTLPWVLHELET